MMTTAMDILRKPMVDICPACCQIHDPATNCLKESEVPGSIEEFLEKWISEWGADPSFSSSETLRRMYFEAIRDECLSWNKTANDKSIAMARKLCEADGHDPDQMVCSDHVLEVGPMGRYVAPVRIKPAWTLYHLLAVAAIEGT